MRASALSMQKNVSDPIFSSRNAGFLVARLKPYRLQAVAVTVGAALAGIADSLSIGLLVPLLANLQDGGGAQSPAALALFTNLFGLLGLAPTLGAVVASVLVVITIKNGLLLMTFQGVYRLAARVSADVRGELATQLLQADIAFHDRHRASDLVDTCYNKTRALETVVQTGFHLIAEALIGIALFALLFTLSWRLTLLALLLCLAGLLLLRWQNRVTDAHGARVAASETRLLAALHDAFYGLRLIRISGTKATVLASLEARNRRYAHALGRGNFKAFTMLPVADLLGSLGIAALALLALAMLQMTPAATLTLLLPFIYVLLRLVPLGRHLSHQRARVALLWPNLGALRRLVRDAQAARLHDGERPFPGLAREIRFDGVSFAYAAGDPPALAGASFTIPAGATTAIVGATGSGKSTVARLLLRLYDPQSGRILMDDRPLSDFCMASVYERVGVVSQETTLFNDSIRANLLFTAGGDPGEAAIIDATRRAGIHGFIESLPRGYATQVGDSGIRLSGGQRQRLAIARTLLRDPEILILDEATSALDQRTEKQIQAALAEFGIGRTVIVIAHRLSTIAGADHVIVLKDGQVAETGSLAALATGDSEYQRLATGE